MAENYQFSQEIMNNETFTDVVRELGSDGNELIAAVQEDETVFCFKEYQKTITYLFGVPRSSIITIPVSDPFNMKPTKDPHYLPNNLDMYPKKELLWRNLVFVKSEPPEYNEDQKTYPWNYTAEYNEQQIIYAPQPPIPQQLAQIPANVDYAGELDFDILISAHTANRNSWIHSSQLKKVFINMQNVLPVDVKRNPTNAELYLRATMLYSLPQYAQEVVERCSTHVDPRMASNRDVDQVVMKHVLRCNNPGSIYYGNSDIKEHLSVRTPLGQPQAGMDTVRVNYQFMCKNSCPSGMNRRAVDVIFTLEDRMYKVLGRRKLAVRVCSCPKRDKEKEEKEFHDQQQQPSHHHGRKRKLSTLTKPKLENNSLPNDDAIYEIPSCKVVGRQRAELILKLIRDGLYYEMNAGTLDELKEVKVRESYEEIMNTLRTLQPE